MIYNAGLNLHSSRNIHGQSLSFGNENENLINAQKIATAANSIEDNVLIPGAELGLVTATGAASYKTAGKKLEKMTDKPLTKMSKSIGEFLFKHFNNKNGTIGKFLNKFKPLKKMIAEKGPDSVSHISTHIRNKTGLAIKAIAGLAGAIFVGKEMPRIEKSAKTVIQDLGAVSVATGAMN